MMFAKLKTLLRKTGQHANAAIRLADDDAGHPRHLMAYAFAGSVGGTGRW